jgi:choline dehydrogenase
MVAGSYGYVIVGAGSAGCVLANRLSADPMCRVALLEAGGPDRAREIHIPVAFTKFFLTGYDWNFRTSKQPQLSDRQIYWPRGKTLGGSSSINGQAWTRGHRVDYDGWAQSCPGWSYDEVLPYFQRAEHRVGSNAGGVCGTSGPQFISELRDPNPTTAAFLAGCAELGLRRLGELNEPDNTGYAPTPVTQRRGLRHSAADAYLRPARRRRNLTVLTGAYAQRILLEGSRATGVEYRDAAGVTQRVTASREVILSAGTVNSPQPSCFLASAMPTSCALPAWSRAMSWWASVRTCRTTGRRDRRSLPKAGHTRRGWVPGPTGPVPARASRDAHLQRGRGDRLRPQRPSSGRPRS